MSAPAPEAPALQLRLFGTPRIHAEGCDLTSRLSKRAVWLLAILALHPGEPVDRHKLAGWLWPESPDSTALHNLRQTLNSLRTTLGALKEIVQAPTTRSLVLPTASMVYADVWEFDQLVSSNEISSLERCMALHQQPLLLGCDEPFAAQARHKREEAVLGAIERLATLYRVRKDARSAIQALERAVEIDPYRESAVRSLMLAYSDLGQPLEALEQYRNLRNRVRADLDSEVSDETRELAQSIRAAISMRKANDAPRARLRRVPLSLTALIGRNSEQEEIAALLDRGRLVTLTGAGGVGKTRLAIAAAERVGERYADGAVFADLAPLQSGNAVPNTLALVLGVQEQAGRAIAESVVEWLSGRELLLILDNCEHLVEGVFAVVEAILSAAPRVRFLATSRRSLGVRGELLYPVEPLSVPSSTATVRQRADAESVRLFLDRSPSLAGRISPAELGIIASICRRLDGLPLAIELAAARTNVLSLKEIEARMRESFDLLAGGARSLARHQTLAASMEWSWEQLSNEEQQALRRLSAFQGGCTLAAAEFVLDSANALDLLGALLDRSLIKREQTKEASRYTLLETIRQFAGEKLRASGEREETFDRHRGYFLEWVRTGDPAMHHRGEEEWFERYERDHDNLRAAIAWSHERGQHGRALELCVYLSRFWDTHGHLSEGRDHLEHALSFETPGVGRPFRGRARVHAGWMAATQQDCRSAIRHYEEALEIALDQADVPSTGRILNCIGDAYATMRDFGKAREFFERSLEKQRQRGHLPGIATVQSNLSEIEIEEGDLLAARARLEEGLAALGSNLTTYAESGGLVTNNLAFVNLREGNLKEAERLAIQAVRLFYEGGLLIQVPSALGVLGLSIAGQGRSSPLLGAAPRLASAQGIEFPGFLSRALSEAVRLYPKEPSKEGSDITLEQAVEFALNLPSAEQRLSPGIRPDSNSPI